jgi:E3 ubiquitin-protein ligase TRIP12
MKEYLRLTLNCVFNDAVKLQVNAFRRGINNVFRMDALKLFLFEELEGLISGEDSHSNKGLQKWNKKMLLEHVIPDHGYDKTSPAFLNFIEYMEGLDREEIRNFLMFITGSPRLPLGGFKSLRPKLTVVKRTCGDENPDDFLPSVMTCQNYVKLPEYSSLEILKEKMSYAVREGVNSFNLS